MNKFLVYFIFCICSIPNFSMASEEQPLYIEGNLAIKMIDKSGVKFISAKKMPYIIKGSRQIEVDELFSGDIIGKLECSPLYSCSNRVTEYLSSLGIKNSEALILYDNHYGIYASTLYSILESIGHKNLAILNGGLDAVINLDPNQKVYNKYSHELKKLLKKVDDENITVDKSNKVNDLKKKLDVLKLHLLTQSSRRDENITVSRYTASGIHLDYLLSKKELKKVVKKKRINPQESNITIVDSCPLVDIVGSHNGNYELGVEPISWKYLIDKELRKLKSKEELERFFQEKKLDKKQNYYIYCMASSYKAFFMMSVMRELGYQNVKVFTGDWNHWEGDIDE